jgi:hypothetical protein
MMRFWSRNPGRREQSPLFVRFEPTMSLRDLGALERRIFGDRIPCQMALLRRPSKRRLQELHVLIARRRCSAAAAQTPTLTTVLADGQVSSKLARPL